MNNILKISSILFVALLMIFVSFYRLDTIKLTYDESETSTYAQTITKENGFMPKIWDGQTLIVQYPDAHDVSTKSRPLMQSWGQYYVEKLSFTLSGSTNVFFARLPFVLLGLGALLFLYLIAKDYYKNNNWALGLILIFGLSYQYLGFVRMARYYSLSLFFALGIIYIARQAIISKKSLSNLNLLLIGILGTGMYYSHYLSFGFLWISLMVFFLINRDKHNFVRMFLLSIAVAIFTVPEYLINHWEFAKNFTGLLSNSWLYVLISAKHVTFGLIRMAPYIFVLFYVMAKKKVLDGFYRLILVMYLVIFVLLVFVIKNYSYYSYYLFMAPLGIMVFLGICFAHFKTHKIVISVLIFVVYLLINLDFMGNVYEANVYRQLTADDSYYGNIMNYTKNNIRATDKVMFIPCGLGEMFLANRQPMKWVGILDKKQVPKHNYYQSFPDFIYNDYKDVDYFVVIVPTDTKIYNTVEFINTANYKIIYDKRVNRRWNIWRYKEDNVYLQRIYKKVKA